MAPAATNGDAASSLDDVKPPSGVVLPPREIRTILEKTAGYVARNGFSFEERIRDKERQNPKFSFLSTDDAYNPFYQWRLDEIRSGRGTTVSAGRAGEVTAAAEQKPKGPIKPPDFEFSAKMPRINQKDLDVLRLTALFVAKNGRQFTTQLGQREAGNPQFQFLIPNHTFHNYFQHLVDQYSALFRAGGVDGEGGRLQDQRVADLKKIVQSKQYVLTRARQRADFVAHQEVERQQRDIDEEKRKLDFARIDWNDFVVVETIVFGENEDSSSNLPPPTSLSELQYATLEDRKNASISANMRIEEAFPTDNDAELMQPPAQIPTRAAFPLPAHPARPYQDQQPVYAPPSQPSASVSHDQSRYRNPQEEEEERRIQERAEARARIEQAQTEAKGGAGPMKIRENYVPRAAQKAANKQGQVMATCPNCNQKLPIDELSEHMRIELLDPRWREQKAKADSRYATSNVTMSDVSANLKRLASQRSDVFDSLGGHEPADDDATRRKRPAVVHSFDGLPPALAEAQTAQKFSVEEQIARIHQKFATEKGAPGTE